MTIATTVATVSYVGNGATTVFDFAFPIPTDALVVTLTEDDSVTTLESSEYTASGLDEDSGGTVTLSSAPTSAQTLTIRRQTPQVQETRLVSGAALYAEVVETQLDRQVMMVQDMAADLDRAVKVPVGSSIDPDDYLSAVAASASAAASSAAEAAASASSATALVGDSLIIATGGSVAASLAWRFGLVATVLDFIPSALHAGIRDTTGTTDLSTYLQSALDAGVGRFPAGRYCSGAALTSSASAVIDMEPGAYLDPTGSGYTALTITEQSTQYTHGWNIRIHRKDFSQFTGNGLVWSNPAQCEINAVKVYGITGKGIYIENMWDCVVKSLSVVSCGTSTDYALTIDSTYMSSLERDETSNTSFIDHAQVELSSGLVMYVSPSTVSIVINNIHSERQILDGTADAWVFGGRCTINQARLQKTSGTSNIKFSYFDGTITDFVEESGTAVVLEGSSSTHARFVKCSLPGAISTTADQLADFTFLDCSLTGSVAIATGGTGWLFDNCAIGTLSVGYTAIGSTIAAKRVQAQARLFRSCRIASLSASSSYATAMFDNCVITYSAQSAFAYHIYIQCSVVSGGVAAAAGSLLETHACRLGGDLVGCDNAQGWIYDTRIDGNVTGDGSGEQPFAFRNSSMSTVSGSALTSAPTYGNWKLGEQCDRMPAAVGYPRGWIYTASGWTALANL